MYRRESSRERLDRSCIEMILLCNMELIYRRCKLYWRRNTVKLIPHIHVRTITQFQLGDKDTVETICNKVSGFWPGSYQKSRTCDSTRTVRSMRTALFNATSSTSAAIEEMYPVAKVKTYILKRETSQQMNGLFRPTGVRGISENWLPLSEYGLSFVATFLKGYIKISARTMLAAVRTSYSDPLHNVHVGSRNLSCTEAEL